MTDFIKSNLLEQIEASPTIEITQLGRMLRAEGRDIVSLSIGEPDFDTPEHVRNAAHDAIERGETKYPPVPGIPELREAITAKFKRDNQLEFSADDVSVCAGGKQVITNALQATLNPGDEVIIPSPYWVSYPKQVILFGALPVYVNGDESTEFKMRPEALQAAITPRTRWLILNSPGNPSGATYRRDELLALAEVLRKYPQVWVFSDDIYEHLLYDDQEFVTFAQVAPDLRERTLTMNGVSKAYAMTGWRIGYAAGPAPLIRAMNLLQSQTTGGANRIAQWAAVAALDGPQKLLSERCEIFDSRRQLVVKALNAVEGIDCLMPGGAFYAYPSCAPFIGKKSAGGKLLESDHDFCMALLDEKGVATVPGSAFGMGPNFRISYAASTENLIKACDRIREFCAELLDSA